MSQILAALAAIPKLIELAGQILEFIKRITGQDPQGFIKKSAEVFSKLNQAKTPQEKEDAARGIQNLIRSL